MATGTVKWYLDTKGFGFISPDGGGQDVYFGFSAIQVDGFQTLAEGQKVEFELVRGPRASGTKRPPRRLTALLHDVARRRPEGSILCWSPTRD